MRNSQLYLITGFLLGWGAPAGAILLRFFLGFNPSPTFYQFVVLDWTQNAFFYWYMLVGTCLSFSITGFYLGQEADLRIR